MEERNRCRRSGRREGRHYGAVLLERLRCRLHSRLLITYTTTCYIFGGMLISYGCYKKLPQMRWLATTKIFSLTVLEARSQSSVSLSQSQGVSRAGLPWEAPGENPSPASSGSWWLPAFLDWWSHHSNPASVLTLPLFCLHQICPCPSLRRTLVMAFRAHLDSLHQGILNLITCAKVLFPNKVAFTSSRD